MSNVSQHSPVPIVTAFLAHRGKVAVFQRSRRVGTYQGAWAGVSGYVERLPLRQALVEIAEEAGLGAHQVQLRGIGIPLPVRDDELRRDWLVYPFLFEVRDPDLVRHDWEAEQLRWIEPREIAGLPTVPGLDRALAAVWPAFGDDEFWRGLSELAVDTSRGATALALAGLETLERFLQRDPGAPFERAVRAFAATRSSMGIFPHLAAVYLMDRPSVRELAESVREAASVSADRAALAIGDSRVILTNSYSSTVRESILRRRAAGVPVEVIVAESRPGMEGVTLAAELAEAGMRVTVITDAQTGVFAAQSDCVLVGCDCITGDDQVQNKAGTSLMALAAQFHGVPCYAVTQTMKILPPGFPHVVEEQEPAGVGEQEGLIFRNQVFDLTPIRLFDAVYTENGALTAQRLSAVRACLAAARLI